MMLDMTDAFRVGQSLPVEAYNAHAATVVLSRSCREYFTQKGVRNVSIVHPGVNREIYNERRQPGNLSQIFNPIHETYRRWGAYEPQARPVVMAGFLQEKKAVGPAVQAYSEWCRRNPGHDTRMLIKNTTTFWGKSVVEEIASNVGPNVIVEYTEQEHSEEEFADLLAAAYFVFQPSHLEGFGMIPLQAMACGKAVVVTGGHGYDDYAQGSNAVIIPTATSWCPQNPSFPWHRFTLEDAVDALSTASDAARTSALAPASIRTSKEFSWLSASRELEALVESLGEGQLRGSWRPKQAGLTTISVAVHGEQHLIDRLESSLYGEEEDYELRIQDDASPSPITSKTGKVLRVPFREGMATARNRSVLEACGEYVLLTDADVEIREPILKKLIERINRCEVPTVLAPKLIYPNGTIQSAGGVLVKSNEPPYVRTYHRAEGRPSDALEANVEAVLDYAPTACLFFQREILERISLWWEEFGKVTWWEDVCFCLMLRKQGVEIRYFPEVEVVHHAGSYTSKVRNKEEQHRTNAEVVRRLFPDMVG
jgi:GT2 family glycosyltransferase